MKTLIFVGTQRLEWHDAPDLHLQSPLEAIVRPIASTTCDLDRRIIAGTSPFEPPFAIGHECVAEVKEVGAHVRSVRRGDLVVVPWHISCGVCPSCRRGWQAHCEALPGLTGYGAPIGGDFGGLFSDEVRVPFADGMLVRVPDGVDPAAVASASDNLTDAYIAVSRGLSKHPGAPVLVVGGIESLGLFAVDHALAAGAARVDYVDADERRRAAAKSLGAYVHPAIPPDFTRRIPVVIGATRSPDMLASAIRCLAPMGHLSNLAMFFAETPLPLWELYSRDASLSMGFASVGAHIATVLDLARCGHIHPERLMTRHQWDAAPSALLEPDIKPVMVRPAIYAKAQPGGLLHLTKAM